MHADMSCDLSLPIFSLAAVQNTVPVRVSNYLVHATTAVASTLSEQGDYATSECPLHTLQIRTRAAHNIGEPIETTRTELEFSKHACLWLRFDSAESIGNLSKTHSLCRVIRAGAKLAHTANDGIVFDNYVFPDCIDVSDVYSGQRNRTWLIFPFVSYLYVYVVA